MNTAEALGYGKSDRLLIVNADDFGMCHAVNEGVRQLLMEGAISSATVMMPCPWAKEAVSWAAKHPACDVGVHLTFTSEWPTYKWGPVTRTGSVASLLTEESYFPADSATVEREADPDDIRREIVSQIELALRMGLKPSHADNHMGSLYGLHMGRDFLEIVLDVCAAYGLPFRLPRYLEPGDPGISPQAYEIAAARAALADQKGVAIIDHLRSRPFVLGPGETYESFRDGMAALLRSLKPGITEIIIHPSRIDEELKAIHSHWEKRGMELEVFRDPVIRQVIASEGIRPIRWSELQRLMRKEA
ncbi:polysaccharide deacetylase family protein [Paenibacillus elgii]|uniref:polysaccharide deacetylase family protein n=1 Tax=Paenibacillus elgii TaxID=189691 RepID=UPI00203BDE80|nr:polysaccharide deacetylase family protein [Paenibacillus elgii]